MVAAVLSFVDGALLPLVVLRLSLSPGGSSQPVDACCKQADDVFKLKFEKIAVYLQRYFVEFLVISTLGYLTLPAWVNGALPAGGLPGLRPGPAGGLSCRACRRPVLDVAVLRLR